MIDLVIFDCDGVLIDSEVIANQVEVDALKQLGLDIEMEEYLDLALGRTNDEVEQQLACVYGIELPEDYWHNVEQRQTEQFQTKLGPIPGIHRALDQLTLPYCVASSSGIRRLELTLSAAGLLDRVKQRLFGRECVVRGKPEPDIFLYAAAQMGIDPSKCLVIEDSLHGVHAGNAAGMRVWGFCGGKHYSPGRRGLLETCHVGCVFDDMESLPERIARVGQGHNVHGLFV